MKEENGIWTPPEVTEFSGKYDDAEFTLSIDGKKLAFISLRPFEKRTSPLKYFDIWIVERTGEEWGQPVHLNPPINSGKMEVYPAFSSKGDLYFSSNRDSNWDIYISRYVDGNYAKPKKLSSAINTEYGEWDQAIAPDDSYMVFCSRDRKDSYGGSDLYISFKNKNDTWTKAKNMGKDINSSGGMICPSISPDGKFIFFNTTLNGKNGIYWVNAKVIEELKSHDSK
jgi:Tol biopolymer transport system component